MIEHFQPISNPLLRLSKRGSFWTGEAHDSFSITHGRPPISMLLFYLFSFYCYYFVLCHNIVFFLGGVSV